MHYLTSVSRLSNGNYRLKIQSDGQGVTATGLVTGDVYHVGGGTSDTWDYLPSGGFHYDYQNAFQATSPGKTGNTVAHETLHIDADQYGHVELRNVEFHAECK
jgi:hypothetical protein